VTATVPKAQTWTLTVTSLCTAATARVLTGSVAAGATLSAGWDGKLEDGTAAPPGRYQLTLESAAGTDVARSAALTYGVTATAGVPATCLPITRLAGSDRYGTSVAIGTVAAPTSTTAVLASGATGHLVDGLVAAPLAKSLGAPLLLSEVDALPPGVSANLTARKVTTVYLVGGVGALGQGVVDGLRALGVPAAGIIRLDGANRYATAARVAVQIGKATDVLLASGDDAHLVDALAAGGPAAATGRPILLTQAGSVPPETAAALTSLGATSVLVVGGEGAISSASVSGLPGVTRAAGANRYATAAAVAAAFAAQVPPTSVVVGSGDPANLVDALAGGSLAQLMLLTQRTQLPPETAAFVKGSSVQKAVILGGTGAVSDVVRTQLDQAAG
jgi:putative cell wall-binding protein